MKYPKLLTLLLSLIILTPAFSQDEVLANGSLIIVGGALKSQEIYDKFYELAGGENAKLVIVPTAMANLDNGFERMKQPFIKTGFKDITIVHTRNPEEANKDAFIKPIQEATAVFFMGGRQWRIADGFLNTKAHDEFFKLLDRGGVIAGSSAGASIQGSYLVRGHTKTNVVMMGDHEEGLSFLKDVAIDQHLLKLNRQFDIFEILRAKPELLGIGLDENTGILVQGNTFEVLGESFVAVYDGTFCKFVRDKEDWRIERPEITKLPKNSDRFYLLSKGRIYDLKERKVLK